jgi:hypothetical protein
MAEAFSNKLTRAAGIVTTSTGGAIGINTTIITGISTVGVAVSDLVVNSNFIAGTKITEIGASAVTVDRTSSNTAATTSQNVKFLGPTTAYTSASATKSILIGGTFANNTDNSVNLTVEVRDQSTAVSVSIASKIPVPAGSSFVISDVGKTLLEGTDEIVVYCDSANAIDANLSILTGVN